MKKAIFLDRDGTLNFDPGYLSSVDQIEILPGVFEALNRLSGAGYLLVVVTNQSGIGRGYFDQKTLDEIHKKMDQLFKAEGIEIAEFFSCPHAPDVQCKCRKPEIGLLENAAQKWHIDLKQSYMVGDKASDVQAGLRAGVFGVVLVQTGCGVEESKKLNDDLQKCFVAPSLEAATDWILKEPLKKGKNTSVFK